MGAALGWGAGATVANVNVPLVPVYAHNYDNYDDSKLYARGCPGISQQLLGQLLGQALGQLFGFLGHPRLRAPPHGRPSSSSITELNGAGEEKTMLHMPCRSSFPDRDQNKWSVDRSVSMLPDRSAGRTA